MSSRSAISSPILCTAPAQHGDVVSATSITLSIRGRCAGSAPRLTLQRLDILALLASWRSSAAPTICSRSSRVNANWSGASRSERRPKRWRFSASMIAPSRSRSLSNSAIHTADCARLAWMIACIWAASVDRLSVSNTMLLAMIRVRLIAARVCTPRAARWVIVSRFTGWHAVDERRGHELVSNPDFNQRCQLCRCERIVPFSIRDQRNDSCSSCLAYRLHRTGRRLRALSPAPPDQPCLCGGRPGWSQSTPKCHPQGRSSPQHGEDCEQPLGVDCNRTVTRIAPANAISITPLRRLMPPLRAARLIAGTGAISRPDWSSMIAGTIRGIRLIPRFIARFTAPTVQQVAANAGPPTLPTKRPIRGLQNIAYTMIANARGIA
jgi:hypothetical protein